MDRLDAMQGRHLYQRIKLSKLDMVAMLWRAISPAGQNPASGWPGR